SEVEDFFPVPPPAGLCTAVGGDPPLGGGDGEGLDVDLRTSRLIRYVRDPPAVRRERAERLAERSLEERGGLPIARERKNPELGLRAGPPQFEEQEPAIRRPVDWNLRPLRMEEKPFFTHAARGFFVEVELISIGTGSEGDAAPVRRPDGVPRRPVSGGQPGDDAAAP